MSAGEVEVPLAAAIEPTSTIRRDQQGFAPGAADLAAGPGQVNGISQIEQQPGAGMHR